MAEREHPLAIVTGASSGIGFELARCCAENGFDLVIAADEPAIHDAAKSLRASGVEVTPCEGGAFLDQDFGPIQHVIDTNVTGTLYLIHRVGRQMRDWGRGRILITGSIAGLMPGTYQAVYNGTKALLDSFSYALRAELKDSGVTVTCLMPGATETELFERADMLDTERKQSPQEVARIGFEAMMKGEGDVVTGWGKKLRATISRVAPSALLAEQHRRMAAPGAATKS
jgi:short-subunit dehydrogenase